MTAATYRLTRVMGRMGEETEHVYRTGLTLEAAEKLKFALNNDLRTALRRYVIQQEETPVTLAA